MWFPKRKIAWIKAYGVPLRCWEEAFFKKLGRQIRETHWVDDDTVNRKRREKGKLDKVVSEVNGLHPKVVKFQNSSKLEKWKGLRVSKTQRKGLPLYYQNAKLIIGKNKGKFSKVAKIEELSSSTSKSDSCGFFWKKGECSSKIRIASQLKGDLLSNGLEGNNMGLFSIQVRAQVCSHERSLECGSVVHKQITGLVVDLMNRQDINTQLS
ncbi:hypothetical protein Q3G72_020809 [Acer saccharum]|nr:hypothetical protein Q3G72_020809 [Acer saccharum]